MKPILTAILIFTTTILAGQVQVNFQLKCPPASSYKYVGIRGNTPPLSWEKSMILKPEEGVFTTSLSFAPSSKTIEYKYVLFDKDQAPVWESLDNRKLKLVEEANLTLEETWDKMFIDISKLEVLKSSDLMKDFELIRSMILEVHPGTYRYRSPAEVEVCLQELKQKFQSDLSHQEAYLAISKVLAFIQCDHTFASFYNQSPLLKAIIHEQKDKVPFTFSWIDDKMMVELDASDHKLAAGTEIIKINEPPVKEILDTLMLYAKADGATDKSRIKQLEVKGYPYRHNAFDVFYPILYPSDQSFQLLIKKPDGSRRTISVSATTRELRAQNLKDRYPDFAFEKEKLWGYQLLEPKIGLLKAGTFDDYGMNLDWNKYFKETFSNIKKDKVEHLIVDLRENQGGFDEIGVGLIRHLIKESGRAYGFASKSRYQNFPNTLKSHAQSWGEPWFHQMDVISEKDEEGYFLLAAAEEESEKVTPAKNAFQGEVYFLVSPNNVSMAFYLATAIKDNKIGVLIGEETGGNQRGINGGQILFLRLPNSQIEIDFPVEGAFNTAVAVPNKGVLPDYLIPTSVEDIIQGRDPQLAKALELAKNAQ